MKSLGNQAHGGGDDMIRPHPVDFSRRDLMKMGPAIAAAQVLGMSQGLGEEAKATARTRKIALEEHFTTAELAKKFVAKPTKSEKLFADIDRRLIDFDQLRLETMDKAGIDLAVLSVTTPGVQGEKDTKTAMCLARDQRPLGARSAEAAAAVCGLCPSSHAGRQRRRRGLRARRQAAWLQGCPHQRSDQRALSRRGYVPPALGAPAGPGCSGLPPSRRAPPTIPPCLPATRNWTGRSGAGRPIPGRTRCGSSSPARSSAFRS